MNYPSGRTFEAHSFCAHVGRSGGQHQHVTRILQGPRLTTSTKLLVNRKDIVFLPTFSFCLAERLYLDKRFYVHCIAREDGLLMLLSLIHVSGTTIIRMMLTVVIILTVCWLMKLLMLYSLWLALRMRLMPNAFMKKRMNFW